MIILFTDFGRTGPYVGQLHAAILRQCPEAIVIDLLADVPAFDIVHAAHLLDAYSHQFPKGSVFLSIVDPGVGSEREPVVIEADGRYYVGPFNGLFDIVISRSRFAYKNIIASSGFSLSASFHGRDIFAPVAAMIACRHEYPVSCRTEWNISSKKPSTDLYEVIYIDNFGNAFTGIRAGTVERCAYLQIGRYRLKYAKVFSECPVGECFWYENSIGLIELAANCASAAELLELTVGSPVFVL